MSFKVIGIGEVLWDMLPAGAQLGGAPANFAYHAHAMGAAASVISRVGNDPLGRDICTRLSALGLPVQTLQIDDKLPTGTVDVTLDENGVPNFVIHKHVAWDGLEATKDALALAKLANAVCFGSLAQRDHVSRCAIQRLVAATPAGALRVFDINLRQNFYSVEVIEESLLIANVLKLNDTELSILAKLFGLSGSPERQIEGMARRFGLSVVALTCGAEGSLLFRDGVWSRQSPAKVRVLDTVGAGDSFTAALVMGLLLDMRLEDMHAAAAEVARYVCSCAGATPKLPPSITERFLALQPAFAGRSEHTVSAK